MKIKTYDHAPIIGITMDREETDILVYIARERSLTRLAKLESRYQFDLDIIDAFNGGTSRESGRNLNLDELTLLYQGVKEYVDSMAAMRAEMLAEDPELGLGLLSNDRAESDPAIRMLEQLAEVRV